MGDALKVCYLQTNRLPDFSFGSTGNLIALLEKQIDRYSDEGVLSDSLSPSGPGSRESTRVRS